MNAAPARRRPVAARLLATGAVALLALAATGDPNPPKAAKAAGSATSLEETRLTMGKWIETQQIISKERNEWQQGQDILLARLEVVKKEVATLEEQITEAQASVAEADKKRDELLDENDRLKAANALLTDAVAGMEAEVRDLAKRLPEPLVATLQPLYQRIPTDAAAGRVSAAERYQNVLGILDTINKSNNEISVSYEVRTLSDGAPSEVKTLYIGLGQAYYVSSKGEAGTGRPDAEGWTWEPSATIGKDVNVALEILEGKHPPAFVPLPVRIQ